MNSRGSISLALVVYLLCLDNGTLGRPAAFSFINSSPLTNETYTTDSRLKLTNTYTDNEYEVEEDSKISGLDFEDSSVVDFEENDKQSSRKTKQIKNNIDHTGVDSHDDGDKQPVSEERVPDVASSQEYIGTNEAEVTDEFVALKRNQDSVPMEGNTAPPAYLNGGHETNVNLGETNSLGVPSSGESNFDGPGGGFVGVRPAESEPTPRQSDLEPSESPDVQHSDHSGTIDVDSSGVRRASAQSDIHATEETYQPQFGQNSQDGIVPELDHGNTGHADDNNVHVNSNQDVPLDTYQPDAGGTNTLDHPIDFDTGDRVSPQQTGGRSTINENNPEINNSDREMVDTDYENISDNDNNDSDNDDDHNRDGDRDNVDEVGNQNELNSTSVHPTGQISGGENVPLIISPLDEGNKHLHDNTQLDLDQNETQIIVNGSDTFETSDRSILGFQFNSTQTTVHQTSTMLHQFQSTSPVPSSDTSSALYSSDVHQGDVTSSESSQTDQTNAVRETEQVTTSELLPETTLMPHLLSNHDSPTDFVSEESTTVDLVTDHVSTENDNNAYTSPFTTEPSAELTTSDKSTLASTESTSAEPDEIEEITSSMPPEQVTTTKSEDSEWTVTSNVDKDNEVLDSNVESTPAGFSESPSPQVSTSGVDLERNITREGTHEQETTLLAATAPSTLLTSSSPSATIPASTNTITIITSTTPTATSMTTRTTTVRTTTTTTKPPTTRITMSTTTTTTTTPAPTTLTTTTTTRVTPATSVLTSIPENENTSTPPTTIFIPVFTEPSTNGAIHPPIIDTGDSLIPEVPEIITTTPPSFTTPTVPEPTASTTSAESPDADKISSTSATSMLTDQHVPTEGIPTVPQEVPVSERVTVTTVTSSNAIQIPTELTIKPQNRITPSGNTLATPIVPLNGLDLPPSFVELKFGMSWPDFCDHEVLIRGELVEILHVQGGHGEVTADQIQVINREQEECYQLNFSVTEEILVHLYLMNKTHHYDRLLTSVCAQILERDLDLGETSIIRNKLIEVRFHDEYVLEPATGASVNKDENQSKASPAPFSDPGVTIAIVLAVVGGCCCIGLISIQIYLRRRNRDGPLPPTVNRSFSMTSSDSIQLSSYNKSRPNSGLFNPGLDLSDPPDPTRPLNFTQLANFCADEKRMAEEFQKLPNRMPRLSVVPAGDEDKNRYANVLPLAQTRVKLLQDGSEPRSSYINASFVTGPDNECQYYIATQAPTEETISDFWTMVWQQGSKAIVMLTQLEEEGQSKCAPYFPELVGKSAAQKHGDFLIELKQKDVHQEYIASRLEINNLRKIEKKEIDHFLYTCWPPNGMPEPISLVKLVLDTRPKYEGSGAPLVVHCSPGTGRTCTFIALDLCMRQFEARRIVDVMKTVYTMRQERAGAIQNKEQYSLLYNAINEYATIVISPVVSAASSATTLHALLPS